MPQRCPERSLQLPEPAQRMRLRGEPARGHADGSGQGASAGGGVLWLRGLFAASYQWPGLPPVRLRPLGESAWRLPGEGQQDGGAGPEHPQAQGFEAPDASSG